MTRKASFWDLPKWNDTVDGTATAHMRSRCPVTGQPDWAIVVLYYRWEGEHNPNWELQKWLRGYCEGLARKNHFHETCSELIFRDVEDEYGNDFVDFTVGCLYARRGGIDICPIRFRKGDMMDEAFPYVKWQTPQTIMQ